MKRRNWASRIFSFTPLVGGAASVYLGSPDPNTTLIGTNHNILEMAAHFDQVQLILGNMSTTTDQIIDGAVAIAPNSITDHVQDAAFSTAQAFTFSGAAGVTVPFRVGVQYPTVVLSDVMNLASVDRVDIVGARPLLGFRILQSLPSGNVNNVSYFLKIGSDWGTDSQIGWHKSVSGNVLTSALGVTPVSSGNAATMVALGVRYLARNKTMTIMWIGDSLTACAATTYVNKKYGGYPINSAIANSTLTHPIETVNCGMSSQSAAQYQQASTYLMPILYPTNVVEEFWSPNSISSPIVGSQITDIKAQQATVFTNASTIGAACAMWLTVPECTNSTANVSLYSTSDDLLRLSTCATQAALGYPALDFDTGVHSPGIAPEVFQMIVNGDAQNFTGDGLHPNQAADDTVLTPAATSFVASLNTTFRLDTHLDFQIRIPGGSYLNGLTGSYQVRVPGGIMINERVVSSGGTDAFGKAAFGTSRFSSLPFGMSPFGNRM